MSYLDIDEKGSQATSVRVSLTRARAAGYRLGVESYGWTPRRFAP
jgi:hypothetical protein